MANAVTNAVRLQLDIFSQYAVGARLEEQQAELDQVMEKIRVLKAQRGED